LGLNTSWNQTWGSVGNSAPAGVRAVEADQQFVGLVMVLLQPAAEGRGIAKDARLVHKRDKVAQPE
jgi:hypothetical protein